MALNLPREIKGKGPTEEKLKDAMKYAYNLR
jgi:hypothetical protein